MNASTHRRLRAGLLGIALAAQQVAAQDTAGSERAAHRIPRRVILPVVMAVLSAAAASVYLIPHADEAVGSCTTPSCVLPFTIGAGIAVGYLMGREIDQTHAVRYRQGAPVSIAGERLHLDGEPQWLALGATRGAAGGVGGVHLFTTDAAPKLLGTRAATIRSLQGVEMTGGDVTIAAATGLYVFAADSMIGSKLRNGDMVAITTWRGRRVVATGNRVELEPAAGSRDTAWTSLTLGAPVRALGADPRGDLLWAATDSALVALSLSGDSLERRSSTRLRGGARSVRSDGMRVVVAAGDRGLWVFDVDGATARQRFVWTGARFAYDAIVTHERIYVAAGSDGLFVLDAKAPRGVVLGLARQVGFAVALGVRGDYTYVLDRADPAVHRLRSDFPLR